MIKYIAIVLLIGIILVGCKHENVKPIWTEKSRPPKSLKTPKGFLVTPHEAHQIVWDKHRLSLKHIWHIYADDKHYYIIDSFLGSSPRKALKTGVIICSRTGKIIEQDAGADRWNAARFNTPASLGDYSAKRSAKKMKTLCILLGLLFSVSCEEQSPDREISTKEKIIGHIS